MKRKIFSSILFIFAFSFLGFAGNDPIDWKTYIEQSGVKVYYKIQACPDNPKTTYYIFKYQNTNNITVHLSWKLNVWVQGSCRTCNLPSPNEYEFKLDLSPNQIQEGNCHSDSKIFKLVYIFDTNNPNPQTFSFDGFAVKSTQ